LRLIFEGSPGGMEGSPTGMYPNKIVKVALVDFLFNPERNEFCAFKFQSFDNLTQK